MRSPTPRYFVVQVGFAPLPPPWFHALREIEIDTSTTQAAICRLHFDLSRNAMGDFDALAIDLFRPLTPLSVRIAAGPGLPLTVINAHVSETKVAVQNSPGQSTLEVVAMDALATTMANADRSASWKNMSDDLIALAIFARYGLIPVTVPVPPFRTMLDTITTQRGTDAALLRQLAGRNGFSLYLQPEPLSGRDVGHFHPPLVPPLPPQGVLSIDFGKATNLASFNVTNDALRPRGVLGLTAEPRTGVMVPIIAPAASEPPLGLEPMLSRILPPPIERRWGTEAASPAEEQHQAMAHVTQSARAIQATAEVDGLKYGRPLLPGIPVLVRGAGRLHSGLYMVESVSHRLSRDDYRQSVGLWRNAVGLTGAEVFVDPLAAA